MKTIKTLLFLGPLLLGLVSCGSGEEGDSLSFACEQAQETFGNETQFYGEDCTSGSNTGCSQTFDDCLEGTCEFTGVTLGESICTESCSQDSDCPSAIPSCGSGGVCVSTSSGGSSGGGGSSSGSCSSCLSACSGFSSCCCGSGCICESECTPTCGDA